MTQKVTYIYNTIVDDLSGTLIRNDVCFKQEIWQRSSRHMQ